ncbi:hypothetical protein CDCA_CDCA06G1759 [Cyanidium caldarium]|uniref:Uncharacterized protein n=1 Tax=Cyanidium caldarium TaxID=2771 RepID=A0AAV9IU10_CYACA|nr:hypothetical protein CDCA_CDCA06G1759 [Cyanidium caldarium]
MAPEEGQQSGSPGGGRSSLQGFAERFMAAGVGTSRAGFDFKPDEAPHTETPSVQVPPPTSASPQSSSPLSRSPTRETWRSTFHPGGRSVQDGSMFDGSKDYTEGQASGQSVSEIYAQKRNTYYVAPRKNEE